MKLRDENTVVNFTISSLFFQRLEIFFPLKKKKLEAEDEPAKWNGVTASVSFQNVNPGVILNSLLSPLPSNVMALNSKHFTGP